MNTSNSKTNEPNRFIYQFTDKLNLKNPDKNMASDIQDYFEYIIKKHETIADNPPVQIYVNEIKKRIVFKIKTGYKLELLSEETMQLLGGSKKVIDKQRWRNCTKIRNC